jgi:hypothetical protein
MPRVVPSDVVRTIDRMFDGFAARPREFPGLVWEQLPSLAGLVALVDEIPTDLILLQSEDYTAFTANLAYLRGVVVQFGGSRGTPALRLSGFEENPIAVVRSLLARCDDDTPSPTTAALAFIADGALRDSIRSDIGSAHRDYAETEWKGATVLAGSAIEALLLWVLEEKEKQEAGILAAAVTALLGNRTLTKNPGTDPENWGLHQHVEVAQYLDLIEDDTAKLVRLAKDFRNLIHPGRAARKKQKCDRATALGALAAMEAVARDLTP